MRTRAEPPTNESRAAIAGRVMTVGKAILVAVIMLIVLGQLYSASIVANPGADHDPTARVTNETHLGVAAGGQVQVDVTADHYYDSAPHAEVVYNNSSGAVLTEGTDYEFYENGTLENLQSTSADFDISYSYYQLNTFQTLTTTFGNYGSTAFVMIGLGLIAAGASAALAYFGAFNTGGGGR